MVWGRQKGELREGTTSAVEGHRETTTASSFFFSDSRDILLQQKKSINLGRPWMSWVVKVMQGLSRGWSLTDRGSATVNRVVFAGETSSPGGGRFLFVCFLS